MKVLIFIVLATIAATCVFAAPTAEDKKPFAKFTFEDDKDHPIKNFSASFTADSKVVKIPNINYTLNAEYVAENLDFINDKNRDQIKNLTITFNFDTTDSKAEIKVKDITITNNKTDYKFTNKNFTDPIKDGGNAVFNGASTLYMGLASILLVIISMFTH